MNVEQLIELTDYFPRPTPAKRFYVFASDPFPTRAACEIEKHDRILVSHLSCVQAIQGLHYLSRHTLERVARAKAREYYLRENNERFKWPERPYRVYFIFEFDLQGNLDRMLCGW